MQYEVILNLWYVQDDEGVIYSLRLKPYVANGTDKQKISFLQERALFDYLIAEPFEIPEQFHLQIDLDSSKRMPVTHVNVLNTLDTHLALFENAIVKMEERFPSQSGTKIPNDPLTVLTPLKNNNNGVIVPFFSGKRGFNKQK